MDYNWKRQKETNVSEETAAHLPVMLKETMDVLEVGSGRLWVDATAGAGGHLSAMLERSQPDGKVLGIDRDLHSLEKLRQRFASETSEGRCLLAHANYADLKQVLTEYGIDTITGGILADLGVSSMQLDVPERGFSFLREGPLDMRMDPTQHTTAKDLINKLPEDQLADILYRYGEERLSRPIARRIAENRPINTTAELAEVVSRVVNRFQRGKRKDESHPATRTFQALRIAVNDELSSLENFLQAATDCLAPGARLAVITFHSLEDRLVKQFLKQAAVSCVCPPRQPICTCNKKIQMRILTGKPLLPSSNEILANPRARSAKLRGGEKVS